MIKRMQGCNARESRILPDIMARLGTVNFLKLTSISRCFVARATWNRSCNADCNPEILPSVV